jgi:competence protein ComEA
MKKVTRDYLFFSKKERIALIIFLAIVSVVVLLPFWNQHKEVESQDSDGYFMPLKTKETGKEGVAYSGKSGGSTHYTYKRRYINQRDEAKTVGRLFRFDPNTLDEAGLKELGLRERTVHTIINYRSKGGKFRTVDDLHKIYNLRPEEFARLKPFIVITPKEGKGDNFFKDENRNNYSNQYTSYAKPKLEQKSINVNTADTTAFKSLYGIGSKLAARIVNFRNKLGGFYSIDQVGETYGVPDSTFRNIKPYLVLAEADIQKININTASYDQLKNHPYISSKLAFLIMKYRKDNGDFKTIEDLKPLVEQTNDVFEKLSHYLGYD